jgi:PAS domain S-box-containing protein
MSELRPIDDYRDLFENAPCGYIVIGSDGRISKVNATFSAWTGFLAEKLVGQRLHQILNMAGRIYYETHIAPLLRMQGFFNEFALDFETAAGGRMPVIANAAEHRDADGALLFTALVSSRRPTGDVTNVNWWIRGRSFRKGSPVSARLRNCGSNSSPFLAMTCAIRSRRSAQGPGFSNDQARCEKRRNSVFST